MKPLPLPESLISTLAGHYYTHPEVFSLEQEKIFETMWFCVVRSSDLDKPGAFKTVQVGRESVLVTRSRRATSTRSSTSAAPRVPPVHRGERRGQARVPMSLSRMDLRPRRQARCRPEPDQDARHRPHRLRTAQDRSRMARLRVGMPGRRAAVVRGHGDPGVVDRLGDIEFIDHYGIADLSVGRGSSTTSRPTGSSSSRTSWSAITRHDSSRID